jgi:hypothetical protein
MIPGLALGGFFLVFALPFPLFGMGSLQIASFPGYVNSSLRERLFFQRVRSEIPLNSLVVSQPLRAGSNLFLYQSVESVPLRSEPVSYYFDTSNFQILCGQLQESERPVYFMELNIPKEGLIRTDFHLMDKFPTQMTLHDGGNYLYQIDCEATV